MFPRSRTAVAVALGLAAPALVLAEQPVLTVHGSGTTNPSKCYWHVMDLIETRAKLPMHMTYRGIGSSSGQAEFSNDQKITYFGSGDIPLKKDIYDALSPTETILHIPVFVGAVSFFHNVPDTPTLNLTACALAKIMSRQITEWDHPEITKDNPQLKVPSGGFPIRVARRIDGSSSTSGITSVSPLSHTHIHTHTHIYVYSKLVSHITYPPPSPLQYLAAACPSVWDPANTGSTVEWPEGTLECQGSGGVVDCINEEPGTIGYLDSGHGHGALLEEVQLENRDGNKLTTLQSRARGGIAGAALDSLLPDSPSDDFSDVSLTWQEGEFTWPIAAMTYIYVRQDLSFIQSPQEQALLKAFLQALFDDSYVQPCVDAYEFAKVTGKALQIAQEAINSLQINSSAIPFEFEEDTMLQDGAGDYFISAKRESAVEVELDLLIAQNDALRTQVSELQSLLQQTMIEVGNMGGKISTTTSSASSAGAPTLTSELEVLLKDAMDTNDKQDGDIAAALAMSIISIVLSLVVLAMLVFRSCAGSHQDPHKNRNGDHMDAA